MTSPLLFAQDNPTVILNESQELFKIMSGLQSLPPLVTSNYHHQTTAGVETKDLHLSEDDLVTGVERMEGISLEYEDSTPISRLTHPTTEPFTQDTTDLTADQELFTESRNENPFVTTESVKNSTDFYDIYRYVTFLESNENSTDFNNKNIPVSPGSPEHIPQNYINKTATITQGGRSLKEIIDDLSNVRKVKSESEHTGVTTNIPTTEITVHTRGGTRRQKYVRVPHLSTDATLDEEDYDWSASTLPNPASDDWSATTLPTAASGDWSATTLPTPVFDADDWSATTLQTPASDADDWSATTLPTAASDDWSATTLPTPASDADDWSATTLPTPASDAADWSETTTIISDLANSTDTREQDFLLEASPVTEAGTDPTKNPLDDLANFDIRIMTTRKGLQVDAHDVVFDPSQIAKATSYEGSSYSTATRSATVTTWVDPENRHLFSQQQNLMNLTKSENIEDSGKFEIVTKSEMFFEYNPDTEVTTDVPETGATVTSHLELLPKAKTEFTSVASDFVHNSETELENKELPEVTTKNSVLNNGINKNITEVIPTLRYNVTDFGNDAQILVKDSKNKSEDSLIYGIPVADTSRESGTHLTPSVVIALSVCCSIVLLLGMISIFLWLCRRHRNRSKIYLSHEATKPRAFFTKPMNPALLPNENIAETVYMLEFQKPRAPVMLSDDQRDLYFIERSPVNESSQVENTSIGVENNGFSDIPLNESKTEQIQNSNKISGQDPPKYDLKYKCESDSDSGIKVWSSTGSLYTAASQLTQCSLPPPPYSPSVGEESLCLSVHSLPSLSKKLGMLNV
ncbi:flocculation protein FLO11-like isoform X2 [Homarus americanus]|uniref:flocculation protein FLO11-like isoform X2 n=1 Tax=Homarus americanus TaxID=6706 RepID=UPI001C457C96|nr:flocculation protein FLO11-like isoform X2 [Homarus americanus]